MRLIVEQRKQPMKSPFYHGRMCVKLLHLRQRQVVEVEVEMEEVGGEAMVVQE